MVFGTGEYRYEVQDLWAKRPKWWTFIDVVGVAVDSKDNVYVFNRGAHPVMVFDQEGSFLHSWGEGVFTRPHGITIGPDDSVYCADDKDHTVRKCTPDGRILMTLSTEGLNPGAGQLGAYSDTGYTGRDYFSIKRGGSPFNRPTKAALGPSGEIYVSDGYGNARVHKFSPEGELLLSWGEPGNGPSLFHIPHSVAVDNQGRVYVADRHNNRIQVFTPNGELITILEDLILPDDLVIDGNILYVAELGHRVSVLDLDGKLLSRWGDKEPNLDAGHFVSPHGIAVDSKGDLYVGEVCETNASIDRGDRALQKFIRVR